MRTALLVLALAACSGPASKPPEAPLDNDTGDDTISVTRTPCPGDAALLELAQRVWPGWTRFEHLWCVAVGIDGQPRWYLSGDAIDQDDHGSPHTALVTPAGRTVWSELHAYEAGDLPPDDVVARDVDGNGSDEVIYTETVDEGADAWTVLIVVSVEYADLREDLQIGKHGCVADWDTEGRWFVITGEGACAKYSGRYEWDGMFVME